MSQSQPTGSGAGKDKGIGGHSALGQDQTTAETDGEDRCKDIAARPSAGVQRIVPFHDREWTVSAVNGARRGRDGLENRVQWTRTFVPTGCIARDDDNTAYVDVENSVRCRIARLGTTFLPDNHSDPETAVEWRDSWISRDELQEKAPDALATYEAFQHGRSLTEVPRASVPVQTIEHDATPLRRQRAMMLQREINLNFSQPHPRSDLRFVPRLYGRDVGLELRRRIRLDLRSEYSVLATATGNKPEAIVHRLTQASVRDVLFRQAFIDRGSVFSGMDRRNIEAVLVQDGGQKVLKSCDRCRNGLGPWKGCVVAPGFAMGECANCGYNKSGRQCNFHSNSEFRHHPKLTKLIIESANAPRGYRQPRVRPRASTLASSPPVPPQYLPSPPAFASQSARPSAAELRACNTAKPLMPVNHSAPNQPSPSLGYQSPGRASMPLRRSRSVDITGTSRDAATENICQGRRPTPGSQSSGGKRRSHDLDVDDFINEAIDMLGGDHDSERGQRGGVSNSSSSRVPARKKHKCTPKSDGTVEVARPSPDLTKKQRTAMAQKASLSEEMRNLVHDRCRGGIFPCTDPKCGTPPSNARQGRATVGTRVSGQETFGAGEATPGQVQYIISQCSCGNAQALHNAWGQHKKRRRQKGRRVMEKEDFLSRKMSSLLNNAVAASCSLACTMDDTVVICD